MRTSKRTEVVTLAVILVVVVILCIAFSLLPGSPILNLVLSIGGGVAAALIYQIVIRGAEEHSYRRTRKVVVKFFGEDAFSDDGLKLVYSTYTLGVTRSEPDMKIDKQSVACKITIKDTQIELQYIPECAGVGGQQGVFWVDTAIADHDLKAISDVVGRLTRAEARFELKKACEISETLDASMILFGLSGNPKVQQINDQLRHFGYTLDDPPGSCCIKTVSGQSISPEFPPGSTIGFIVRLRPKQHPQRAWILCGGEGRDGTPMSSWFLANKFETLNAHEARDRKPLGMRPCIVVLQGTKDSHQSAMVHEIIPLVETAQAGSSPLQGDGPHVAST